jgi:hypothetical protein
VHQSPAASLWLTVFDAAADGPRAAKVTYAATGLSYPKDSYVGIGDAILESGRARGSMAGVPAGARWNLTFPDGAPAFAHLP